jgi:glycosyltransferase involved in cell wall biosynthesis
MVEKMIHFFQLEKNCGTGVARNKGISNAGGRYISF